MSQYSLQKRLQIAILCLDPTDVTAALDAGARVNRMLPCRKHPLVLAAEKGNIGAINALRQRKTRESIWVAAIAASTDPSTRVVVEQRHTFVPKPLPS